MRPPKPVSALQYVMDGPFVQRYGDALVLPHRCDGPVSVTFERGTWKVWVNGRFCGTAIDVKLPGAVTISGLQA